jgi:hypothetical protein
MSSSPRFAHSELYQQAYQTALERYGEVGLSYHLFAERMECLIAGALRPTRDQRQVVSSSHRCTPVTITSQPPAPSNMRLPGANSTTSFDASFTE